MTSSFSSSRGQRYLFQYPFPQKKGTTRKFVGIALHKVTISVGVVNRKREVLIRRRIFCCETEKIEQFFRELGEFPMVVEAAASYEWLFRLLEPLAQKAVLAHPQKLRVCDRRLHEFSKTAPVAESEARALQRSIPGVGRVTSETVLSELADVGRWFFTDGRGWTGTARRVAGKPPFRWC